jgi:hypothetical protein
MANDLEKLLGAYVTQLQDLETATLEVLILTRLSDAVGVQLDIIGRIVGRERGSSDDDRYRDLLSAQIKLNLSSGTIQEILAIVELVIPDCGLVLVESFPAAFELSALQVVSNGQGETIAGLIKTAKAAGVNGLFHWHETDPVFKLDGADGSQLDGGYFLATSL